MKELLGDIEWRIKGAFEIEVTNVAMIGYMHVYYNSGYM